MDGDCKEAEHCPVKYYGRVYYQEPLKAEIRQVGEHQHALQQVNYGSIFTAQQELVANRYVLTRAGGRVTVEGLRNAFKVSLPLEGDWPSSESQRNWVKRTNLKQKRSVGATSSTPLHAPAVASIESALAVFRVMSWQAV